MRGVVSIVIVLLAPVRFTALIVAVEPAPSAIVLPTQLAAVLQFEFAFTFQVPSTAQVGLFENQIAQAALIVNRDARTLNFLIRDFIVANFKSTVVPNQLSQFWQRTSGV